jgi:hypothetical protein
MHPVVSHVGGRKVLSCNDLRRADRLPIDPLRTELDRLNHTGRSHFYPVVEGWPLIALWQAFGLEGLPRTAEAGFELR